MAELISSSFRSYHGKSDTRGAVVRCNYTEASKLNSSFSFNSDTFSNVDFNLLSSHGLMSTAYSQWEISHGSNLRRTDSYTKGYASSLIFRSLVVSDNYLNDFSKLNQCSNLSYENSLPNVDVSLDSSFNSVHVFNEVPDPPLEYKYLPSSNFEMSNELISNHGDFNEPIDFEKYTQELTPVNMSAGFTWDGITRVDIQKQIQWGYSLNQFLVGGGTGSGYSTDPDALEPTVEPPSTGMETITVVNIINIVSLPERTPLEFSNFTLAYDLDSFAWVANFDVSSDTTLAIIKPVGLAVKEIEVDINGELFIVFIGRTSSRVEATDSGVRKIIKCTGWSTTKLLSYPYTTRKSYTESSTTTSAAILNNVLTGTGFTGTWDTVSWVLPPGVFSYIEKAPIGAIYEIANSVGAVILPSPNSKSISIKSRYPVSPWNWGAETPDRILNETSFFTIDTNWIPAESPDSIHVYGEEGGVAVKCVKNGTGGVLTLPAIVDKHITDTSAGTERGRVEVAKAGFKEIIPVTTYVDENGIIMPFELLEINPVGGGAAWRGMVISTSIAYTRKGNALVQSLQIERHYD